MRKFGELEVGDKIWFINQNAKGFTAKVNVLVLKVAWLSRGDTAVEIMTNLRGSAFTRIFCGLTNYATKTTYGHVFSDRDKALEVIKSLENKVLGRMLEKYEELEQRGVTVMDDLTSTILTAEKEFDAIYEKI